MTPNGRTGVSDGTAGSASLPDAGVEASVRDALEASRHGGGGSSPGGEVRAVAPPRGRRTFRVHFNFEGGFRRPQIVRADRVEGWEKDYVFFDWTDRGLFEISCLIPRALVLQIVAVPPTEDVS